MQLVWIYFVQRHCYFLLAVGAYCQLTLQYVLPKEGAYVHMCELYLVLGMSLLRFIIVGKGVIDCGLMENITVILFNHGNQMFKVEKRRHDCTINT